MRFDDSEGGGRFSLSPGERVGVRASVLQTSSRFFNSTPASALPRSGSRAYHPLTRVLQCLTAPISLSLARAAGFVRVRRSRALQFGHQLAVNCTSTGFSRRPRIDDRIGAPGRSIGFRHHALSFALCCSGLFRSVFRRCFRQGLQDDARRQHLGQHHRFGV